MSKEIFKQCLITFVLNEQMGYFWKVLVVLGYSPNIRGDFVVYRKSNLNILGFRSCPIRGKKENNF